MPPSKTRKKETMKTLETMFAKVKKGDMVTFENIAKEFEKAPTQPRPEKSAR